MKKLHRYGFILISCFIYSDFVLAANNEEMETKVEFCERCHGTKGFTDNANMPKLAGQNKGYLVRQLENFRRGIRKSTPMHQVTLTLTDDDIEALANYFNNISVSLND